VSWNPGWAWLILAVIIVAFVAVFDAHAAAAHTETMTGRMRDWIADPVAGPFIVGGWVALFAGLMWHFFVKSR